MKITFTGTEKNAGAYYNDLEIIDDKEIFLIRNNFSCTLNNKGKKDLKQFQPILDEYTTTKKLTPKDSISISASTKLTEDEIADYLTEPNKFIKNFKARGDVISLNGIPITQEKNRLYIFKNLQELMGDVLKIKDIELLIPDYKNDFKETALNLFDTTYTSLKSVRESVKPRNIKLNAQHILEALTNNIKRIG